MKLLINGQTMEVANHIRTVSDLLSFFNKDEKIAIVEVNNSILDKSDYAIQQLSDGDKVEIVHFVGGG